VVGEEKGRGPRVYVGGICHDTHKAAAVKAHFGQFGEVVDVYFPKDRATGQLKTFCFVTFGNQAGADSALAHCETDLDVAGKAGRRKLRL
jgi:hypothetical protein